MVKISFIVPVYNVGLWIRPCLESLVSLKEETNDFEIIVVDDGSTDNSLSVIHSFQKEYPGFVFVYAQSNHGVSFSRNEGIKRAKGVYVWFVDGDDVIATHNVSKLFELASTNDLDLLLFSYDTLINGRTCIGVRYLEDSPVQRGRDLYNRCPLNMASWAYLYKRSYLQEYHLHFPEDFKTCEDIIFNQISLFHAERVGSSNLVGYYYRHQENSATHGHEQQVFTDQLRRIPLEIDYFKSYGDKHFLSVLLYRNLREVNVWLAWAKPTAANFLFIRQSLMPLLGDLRMYSPKVILLLWAMKFCPQGVFYFQFALNRLRRRFLLKH